MLGMYLCGLFPALGFFDVYPFRYSFVADHFQYHSLPVGLTAVAAGLSLAAARLRLPLMPLAAGLLTVLATLSFARSGVFFNPETLYLDTLAKTPTSSIAANNLGAWYQQHDRLEEAKEFLVRGARTAIFPDDKSRGLSNLAMVLLRQDRAGEAMEAARLALAASDEPRTRAVMALALVRAGRLDEAAAAFAAASPKALDYPEMQLARGEAALAAGDTAAAMRHFAAFTADPELAKRDKALLEVGIALAQHGRIEEATATFDRITGNPRMVSKAQVNLGVVHARRGDLPAAVAAFAAAVAADPASPDAHGNLAKALLATGRRTDALRHFTTSRALAGKSFAFEEDYRRAAAGSPGKEMP
jgi:tetratricopeptide (TPR) repeat protein